MEGSDAGHWDWNMVTDELFVSERAREMFSLPAGPLPKTRAEFVGLLPPEVRASMKDGVEAAMRSGSYERDYRIVPPAGQVRWMRSRGKVFRDAGGAAVRMAGSVMDISEQKRAEDALRASEERYSLAMKAAEEGYFDSDVATDQFVASERLNEILGIPRDTRFADRNDYLSYFSIHEDDRKTYDDMIRAVNTPGGPDHYELEVRVVLRSGEMRWVVTRGLVTRDAEGRARRRVGVVADITARKLAEQALRASEDRFARAVAGSYDGIWDIDFVGRSVYLSARTRELCGFPPGPDVIPLEGYFEALPIHPEDRPGRNAAVQAHLSGKAPVYEGDFRLLQSDGVYRWRHVHGVCVRDADGKPLRMAGSISDVDARRRAEDALRGSEDRFARAVAGSSDGVWDIDLVGRTVYFSPRTRELCGLPPGPEVVPLDGWFEALPLHPEDLPRRFAAVNAHLSGKVPAYDGEFRFLQPDGVYRWRHRHGVCVRDSDGKPVRMAGSMSDVDARRRAEDALRESEERYERVVAATEAGFWDWDLARNKYYVSPRLLEMAGLPPDTVIAGREDFQARVPSHPEDLAKWQQEIRSLFASGGSRLSTELRVTPAAGTRWIRLDGMCFRDAAGKVVRWTGSAIDVTPRKLAEEALRDSEQRYELAMAASESGYWDWDIPNNKYFASPKAYELGGYEPGEWVTRDDFRARANMHPEDFARWEAAREELFAGTGERLAMEVRYIVSGETRWHSLQAICKRDAAGKVVRWAGSATDITEHKRAEEELKTMERKLRQAQRLEAMGTLAGGIAHDFNNILGAVLGYGEMALRDAPSGSRLARDLKKITVAGERGRALVDRVLAFSRSATGERVPVHVERVVREALDLVSAKLPPRVAVRVHLNAGRAAVLADATQVHQVVSNLATNAVQAMPAGGTLRVELAMERLETPRAATIGWRAAGEYVVLTVADTGAGIAAEIIDRIFDPYFTTKEVGTGTGLGLSLVHGIVMDLSGAIDVASSLGSGTTFTVYLPRSGDAAEPGVEKASALPRGEGQRVLVVDDEEPLVEIATRTLEELGYMPVGFTSSSAALAAFRDDPHRFDALITDERMPGISGSALIREVRGIRASIPIVLMSGYLGGNKAALPIVADDILQKPLSASELAASLARVLRL